MFKTLVIKKEGLIRKGSINSDLRHTLTGMLSNVSAKKLSVFNPIKVFD
jgi:hypothetical protein